jgi:17beta-estradiol 17-dehydrogenase / very-long-chain 3-oxoacyl-CoA reductase
MALPSFFTYLGLATSLYFLAQLLSFTYVHLVRRITTTPTLARYKHGSKETWALITGASAGIGYGFAQELTRHGISVVLLGHKKAELESAQADLLRERPGAEVRLLVVDAISDSAATLQEAVETLKDLHITILVNNVGGFPVMSRYMKPLSDFSLAQIDDTISLNARFMSRLTRLLIPTLAANGPSLIINLSSGAYVGIPWLVMYSATKGFVASFSSALGREMRAEGLPVRVVALAPGDVRSQGHRAELAWNVPSSRAFAKSALDRIGAAGTGETPLVVSPYWVHALMILLLNVLPESVVQAGMVQGMREKRRKLEKDE